MPADTPVHGSAVGDVPSSWAVHRAKFIYKERAELSETGSEELLSASHLTGITKRSDKEVGMFMAETLEGYKKVYSSDCVVNTMWAWMGALGVSPMDGVISPSYAVYRPIIPVNDRFYDYLFRSKLMVAEINRRSKGVWSSRLRLYPHDFLNLLVPVPDMQTQDAIAALLDRETSRIDQLIRKKNMFLSAVAGRIEALVDQAISNPETPRVRFEHVTTRIQRRAVLSEHKDLVRLGLLNRGRGIFKKPAADEEGMGDSEFFFVKEDDLILSGQFAWEGAVALAGRDEEGCVVSHRYPVYTGRDGVTSAYLTALLRTRFGDFILNDASRGAAGRNRPLNVRRLEKEKIPVPSAQLQQAITDALHEERRLKAITQQSIARLEELRASLIADAVTGRVELVGKKSQEVLA